MNFFKIRKNIKKYFFFIFLLSIYCENLIGIENKIIFKINDKAYTSLDYENRKKYLDFVGSNDELKEDIIKNDFISVNLFFEYYKNSKMKIELEKKTIEIFNNIENINLKNNKKYKYEINKENILLNIKLDFVRKTILESILNTDVDSFNKPNEEIDLLYDFRIQYINFNNTKDILNKINNLSSINLEIVELLLKNNGINYFIKEKYVENINFIDTRIKDNILLNKKYFIIKNNNKLSLVFIKKKFETLNGLIANLYSVRSKDEISQESLSCDKLIKNKDKLIIENKEYKFTNLNNQLKENLISINDYMKFKDENNNTNVYIILCDIKYDKEILSNYNLNKLINNSVNLTEQNFLEKYSKIYKLKIINE